MRSTKLPPEAFEFYIGCGSERSYQAVADRFGASKRAVAKRAAVERWQERLSALLSGARVGADDQSARIMEEVRIRQVARVGMLQDAIHEVLTPHRFKALMSALFKSAVQDGDTAAARLLIERVLGKPRNEPLPATVIDIPNGLETAADVRRAANGLLQSIADGSLAPEDAQRATVVLESARRSIETEELEKRIAAIEESIKKED